MAKSLHERVNDELTRKRGELATRQAFVKGDHWQQGRQWTGPRPKITAALSDPDKVKISEVMQEIERAFIQRNLVKEACGRHRNGVVGRDIQWTLTTKRPLKPDEEPTAEETALIEEADAALIEWWDRSSARAELRKAVFDLMWAGTDESLASSMLRMFIPKRAINDAGEVPTATTLTDALKAIDVNHTDPLSSGTIRDSDGLIVAAFNTYEDADEQTVDELTLLERDVDSVLLAALTEANAIPPGFNEKGERALVIIRDGAVMRTVLYDLDGRLPIFELERETLITDAALDQQNLVNLAYTMAGRNVVQGGFLERIITNAQVPGSWVNSAGERVAPNAPGATFQAGTFQVGAGTTNVLAGIPIRDDQGRVTRYTTPSVTYRDPVPVTTFLDTKDMGKEGFLEEVQQVHQLIASDATASGRSRQQAAEDFASSLSNTAEPVERVGREMLETILRWGGVLQNKADAYASLRVTVTPRISAMQPNSTDKRDAISLKDADILSDQTAMTLAGIDDPDAEMALKDAERERQSARENVTPGAVPPDRLNPEIGRPRDQRGNSRDEQRSVEAADASVG